ncbi:MAG: hypothetical protein K6E89_04660 [Sphaerochaetaceae bacterium]|nr:hypothetical protein [Sphaerochaetaceae bacterium]
MAVPVVKTSERPVDFVNGYGEIEVLKGTHKLVRCFKCELKAGSTVHPKLFADSGVFYCFTKGRGYITTKEEAFNIKELSFFCPDWDHDSYAIYAATDMEFVKFVTFMVPSDWKHYEETHSILPFFKSVSQGQPYTQSCKGPHTMSWSIMSPGQAGRFLCGVVKGVGKGEGTVEKGHPSVDQWNVILEGSDILMDVDGEKVHHVAGEISYIYAGPDHSLIPNGPDKTCYYIWFEHKTAEWED